MKFSQTVTVPAILNLSLVLFGDWLEVNCFLWGPCHILDLSQTRLSDFTFIFHFHALEKEMATHSSVLAWKIPGTGEPGGLLSMGLHRVGHD